LTDAAEAAYRDTVRTHLRRNYLAHLAHGLLGQTGFRLLNAPTFMPAYLFALSGSDLAVGLARGLQSFGMFLSPILGATSIEHRRRVLPVGFVVGGAMRVQVLLIALAGFFLPDAWNLRAVLLCLGLFGFFMGMQGVIFTFLLSKVIPVERRGRLLGLRNALAGITAAAVAWLGGRFLVEPDAFGNGYAATFGVAFVLTSLGLVILAFVREPEPPGTRAAARVADRLRELPALLRSDRGFTWYFVARALATMGQMSAPFYVLYAGQRIEIGGAELGDLSLAFLLAMTTTNLAWGWLADRSGFRLPFLLSVGLWVASALALLYGPAGFASTACAFVGLGAGQGGFMMASQNLVLEFGSREELPMRIAVANSAAELVGAIGPVLGGALATAVSYAAVFQTAIAFQLAALVVVVLYLREPRLRQPG
jgi:MFS family permease